MARYEEIEIDGELVPIQFGMGVIMRFCNKNNIPFVEYEAKAGEILNNVDYLESFIYEAFRQGHRSAKKELTIDQVDVLSYGPDVYSQYIDLMTNAMNNQKETGNPEGGAKSGNGKKPQRKKAVKA